MLKSFFLKLKSLNKLNLSLLLGLSCIFSIFLIIFRIHYTGKVTYIFLIWNLFLAFIPYGISTLLICYEKELKNSAKFLLYSSIFVWFIFFPNSPYIITDFLHLKARHGIPLWFDIMLILSTAWNGLLLGLLSLMDIQSIITNIYSKTVGWVFSVSVLLLSGLGIYIGRYLRWNSWDIVTNPIALFYDVLERFVNPLAHTRTLGVTVFYAAFLLLAYLFVYHLARMHKVSKSLD